MTDKENIQYIGFWKRLWAGLIDLLLIMTMWLGYVVFSLPESDKNIQNILYFEFNNLLAIVMAHAYFLIMEVEYNGQTIGGRVTGIKLVMEDGSKLTYGKALLREVVSNISFIVLFLGYFWIAWDKKKQAWHDKIAQTLVIKA